MTLNLHVLADISGYTSVPFPGDIDEPLVFRAFQVFITPSSYTVRSRRTSAEELLP